MPLTLSCLASPWSSPDAHRSTAELARSVQDDKCDREGKHTFLAKISPISEGDVSRSVFLFAEAANFK